MLQHLKKTATQGTKSVHRGVGSFSYYANVH